MKTKAIAAMAAAVAATQLFTAVYAAKEYATPTVPQATETPMESAAPSELQAQKTSEPTSSPEETHSPLATSKPEDAQPPKFTAPTAGTPTAIPAVTAAPTEGLQQSEKENPAAQLSDQEFMDSLTLAFIDGVSIMNPDRSDIQVQAVLVQVPERRMGSAQWFVNGEALGDYYSSEFELYSGKLTSLRVQAPFRKGMTETGVDVALEVHLNGVIRRIEKYITFENYDDDYYDRIAKERALALVKPVHIEATVTAWTDVFTNKYLGGKDGSLGAGSEVIYLDHYSDYSAYIWIPERDQYGWVPYDIVRISGKDYTVYEDFSQEDKESYVNAMGYSSTTDYLVWINLERQKVNLFLGSEGGWKLEKSMPCASGANTTPTPMGTYTYCAYDTGWFNAAYTVKPVLYINKERAIAMHSILLTPDASGVVDGTLGTPKSHGCIRMAVNDVRWLANVLPMGSTVVVY